MKLRNMVKKFRSAIKNTDGFTFMEIMIALMIIALFLVIVGPRLIDLPKKAQATKCKQEIKNMEMALEQYYLDNSNYPTTEQGLIALVQKPTLDPVPRNYSDNGYLNTSKEPKDPWGNDYIYRAPGSEGRNFEIISYGSDGKEGGSGSAADILNWEIQ